MRLKVLTLVKNAMLMFWPFVVRKTFVSLIIITVVLLLRTSDQAEGAANMRPGNWPGFMRDGQLSGLSPLSDQINDPKVLWSHFIGSRETFLEVDFKQGIAHFDLPKQDISVVSGDPKEYYRKWDIYGPYYDLDQTGLYTQFTSNELQTNYYKIADFLPDVPGLEKIEWMYEVPKPLSFYIRKDGQWHTKWQIESPVNTGGSANRNAIVDDFDGDGQLETAGLWWYKLMVVDLLSGKLEQVTSFYNEGSYSGRGYGWLGSYDFDGDGKTEIVLLGDTENHLDVFGWKDKNLVKLWGRLVESGIAQKKTIVVPGIDPLQDIDGDAVPEIVLSVFNYDYTADSIGDGFWHIIALEALTGKLKLDIKQQFLSGLDDIDHDGISELLTTSTSGEGIDDPGQLRMYSLKNQQLTLRWQCPHLTAFVRRNVNQLPLNMNTSSPGGWEKLLIEPIVPNGKPVFATNRVVEKNENIIEAMFWQADAIDQVKAIGTLKSPYLEVLTISAKNDRHNGQSLVKIEVPKAKPAKLSATGVTPNFVQSAIKGVNTGSPVVGVLKPGEPSTIVVEAGGKVIEAFQPYAQSGPETRWRTSGHSSINNIHLTNDKSVLLADLTGDGNLETIFASKNAVGDGRIVAVLPDGNELWHHDFEGIPCQELEYILPGMGGWYAGNFTSREHLDLLVTLQRGTGHTGQEGHMLSGLDGKEIWHRTKGGSTPHGSTFGVGGEWMIVCDYDGDGLDDILSNFPQTMYVMRGYDGKLLLDKFIAGLYGPEWVYNGFVATGDYRGFGQVEIFYGVLPIGFSLLDHQADLVWNNPDIVSPTRPAVGDIDGDGRLEFVQMDGNCLRAIDTLTGSVEWSLTGIGGQVPSIKDLGKYFWMWSLASTGEYVPPVLADVTGDGSPDCIAAKGSVLQAVTCLEGKAGKLLWEVQLPDTIGTPAIATLNEQLQIIVVCRNGFVYGIGH